LKNVGERVSQSERKSVYYAAKWTAGYLKALFERGWLDTGENKKSFGDFIRVFTPKFKEILENEIDNKLKENYSLTQRIWDFIEGSADYSERFVYNVNLNDVIQKTLKELSFPPLRPCARVGLNSIVTANCFNGASFLPEYGSATYNYYNINTNALELTFLN
jgi:hypothetical protein